MKNILFKSCILLCLFLVRPLFAQNIDTLFTTPEERAYLNFLREEFLLNSALNDFNIDEVVPAVPVIDVVEDAPSISSYSLSGIFTRQDGSKSIWLNENNITENSLPANMILVETATDTFLRIQTDAGEFDLRAGQTLDVVNAQVIETWQITNPESSNEVLENTTEVDDGDLVEDQIAEPEESSLITDITEQVDPLPELERETLTISTEEISSILSSDDPAALTEFMQTLQNFEEVQIDENSL